MALALVTACAAPGGGESGVTLSFPLAFERAPGDDARLRAALAERLDRARALVEAGGKP